MLNMIKHALLNCPLDGNVYLIEKLSDNSGFFTTDKHLLYMVYNFENIGHQSTTTEFLKLNTSIDIVSIKNNQAFPSGEYNILELIPVDNSYNDSFLESFVNLCVAHTNYMESRSFVRFFYSLISIFQMPRDQQYKNLVGLFGELSFIKYLCDNHSIDLSAFWHKTSSEDKYEFSLSNCNIEVKSTSSIDENIVIKHEQIFNGDNNYLIVVCIEESTSGKTLNQLISMMQNDKLYYKNYNFAINVERERNRVSPIDSENKQFAVKSIMAYEAKTINPFNDIPDNIYGITYKMDLSGEQIINENDWKYIFKV